MNDDDEGIYLGVAMAILALLLVAVVAVVGPVISDWILQ
jgi:hypothetical protein